MGQLQTQSGVARTTTTSGPEKQEAETGVATRARQDARLAATPKVGDARISQAFRSRLDELATDVGRLRRRLNPDSSAWWMSELVAGHVESLTCMVEPSAAELAAWHAPGDDEAITEAIRIVDERSRRLHKQLGWRQ